MVDLGRTPAIALALAVAVASVEALRVEVLESTGGLPAHIAGAFSEPLAFQRASDGTSFVFDRRAHAVYRVDVKTRAVRKIVEIGAEEGRILEPSAFDLAPDGSFVVADGPNARERVQIFRPDGVKVGGFTLPGRNAARLTIGGLVLNGVGSLEYTLSGGGWRTVGRLRPTGHESDRDLHLALNVGLPLAAPDGGLYVVFIGGVPMFRKYTRDGRLEFERHIEGVELDGVIQALPSSWPRRRVEPGGELPLVLPAIRTAAVDPDGHLWIALIVPYTYVYDASGDKVRTVQFRGAGLVSPTSLFFADRRTLLITPGCYEFTLR